MKCVLDASVSLTWLLRDAGAKADAYAFNVLAQIGSLGTEIHVPAIWGLEVANVIARAESGDMETQAQSEAFLEMLAAAPIQVDAETAARSLSETLQLARRYRLSAYDASYLELALRCGLPLATLDVGLQRAASKAGVKLLKAAA